MLNATIDRYAYAHMTFLNAGFVRFRASDFGISEELELSAPCPMDQGLILHRAVYNRIVRDFLDGEPPSVDVSTTVDAPAGSGLGSSSRLLSPLWRPIAKPSTYLWGGMMLLTWLMKLSGSI